MGDVASRYEYVEQAVAYSRQRVALRLVTERGLKTPHYKEKISRNFIQTHRHGRKFWNGKWTIWSLALILSVFENRNVKRIFGYLREEVQESGENYMMRNFIC